MLGVERPNAGTVVCRGGRLDINGEEWVESIMTDGHYDKQTFGWISTSIESFLEENDLPVEPN